LSEISTVNAKHIFIDIVNYTHKRSVEAQVDVIKTLNDIVSLAIKQYNILEENVIYIPTGDGMCISLIDIHYPYDIHLQFSLTLLEKLNNHNMKEIPESRKFLIRIGINENIDNLITDINGRENISGSGINIASRIEGLADASQILVGYSVYDKLINRERYMKSFIHFSATVKHGVALDVYQYHDESKKFINNNTPTIFEKKVVIVPSLTLFEAHYLAMCIVNQDFIISKAKDVLHLSALHSLVYIKTLDKIGSLTTTMTNPTYTVRAKADNSTFFDSLMQSNIWLNHELHHSLLPLKLSNIANCFKESFLIVNEYGKKKLKSEHENIFLETLF
jgi:class 3 adenylate cyclase